MQWIFITHHYCEWTSPCQPPEEHSTCQLPSVLTAKSGDEIILFPIQWKISRLREGACFSQGCTSNELMEQEVAEPGVKSSNPGYEVSICCFNNWEKAKEETLEENLRIRNSFTSNDLIYGGFSSCTSKPRPTLFAEGTGSIARVEGRILGYPLW